MPSRLGPARVALSTGSSGAHMTLYLYDTAAEAAHRRRALHRSEGEAALARTAGFCLYVGQRRLTRARFDQLFDVAEGRGRRA